MTIQYSEHDKKDLDFVRSSIGELIGKQIPEASCIYLSEIRDTSGLYVLFLIDLPGTDETILVGYKITKNSRFCFIADEKFMESIFPSYLEIYQSDKICKKSANDFVEDRFTALPDRSPEESPAGSGQES